MVYLKLPKILGTVKAKDYRGWVHVESASLGKKDPWDGGSPTGTSRPTLYRDLSISRKSDRVSIDLAKAHLLGEVYDDAILAFVDAKSKQTTLRLAMTKATIEEYSMAGAGADLLETFVLTFETLRPSVSNP